MSPELGMLLFVALLWGPTALWMVYRGLRGAQRRVEGYDDVAVELADRTHSAPNPVEELVGPDGFWICGTCRSLNRRGAPRCYGCRSARDAAGPEEAPGAPAPGLVPVMATDVGRIAAILEAGKRPSGAPASTVAVPGGARSAVSLSSGAAVATMVAATPPKSAPSRARRKPASAPGTEPMVAATPPKSAPSRARRKPASAPGTEPMVAATPPKSAPSRARRKPASAPGPEPMVAATPPKSAPSRARRKPASAPGPEPMVAATPAPADMGVCPFLGWKDDPSTRFDFPDAANRCHATPQRVAQSLNAPRLIAGSAAGGGRSRTIDTEHQRTHCLAASHRLCARYPAVEGGPGSR